MTARHLWAAAVATVMAAALAACSLMYRSSDYFDPTDQVTVIGTGAGNATTIVLTSSLVVYATSTGVYALPKSGGDPVTLQTFAAGDLVAMASNETDLVAWCGAMGVQIWRPGGAVTAIDTGTDCDSVDVYDQDVAAALTSGRMPAGSASFRIVLYRGSTFDVDLEAGAALPAGQGHASTDLVSLTHDGLYYASGDVIGRKPRSGDTLTRADPFCGLGVAGGTAREFRAVELRADGGVLTLYRANLGFRFGTNDTCCRVVDGGTSTVDTCPKNPLSVNTSYHNIVIREPYVYYLPDNELRRAPLGAPDDASTLVRGGLNEVLGSLAVDDTFAYLGIGDRILRVALPRDGAP